MGRAGFGMDGESFWMGKAGREYSGFGREPVSQNITISSALPEIKEIKNTEYFILLFHSWRSRRLAGGRRGMCVSLSGGQNMGCFFTCNGPAWCAALHQVGGITLYIQNILKGMPERKEFRKFISLL